jgi:hypothetical protein
MNKAQHTHSIVYSALRGFRRFSFPAVSAGRVELPMLFPSVMSSLWSVRSVVARKKAGVNG